MKLIVNFVFKFLKMNFLAHLFLSGNNRDIKIGNFITDHIKGKIPSHYNEDILKGIELHKKIDRYTDNHPIVKQSIKRLRPRYKHYSSVIIDLYYDHFLALKWNQYTNIPLDEFARDTYFMLNQHYDILPAKTQRILPYMIKQNWLSGYRDINVMNNVFFGMSQRTRFNSGMENATIELIQYHHEFEEEFTAFFPQIIQYIQQQEKLTSVN